jgi:uncharacterized protein (DUF885 family)
MERPPRVYVPGLHDDGPHDHGGQEHGDGHNGHDHGHDHDHDRPWDGDLWGAGGEEFHRVAERVVDALLESFPEAATDLGEHRFDDRLDDLSAAGLADRAGLLAEATDALDSLDDSALDRADLVDLELLRTWVSREQWTWTELRPQEHDPLLWLPGDALYPLLARDPADPAATLRALAARLAAVPDRLTLARNTLRDMPQVHVRTAAARARGTVALLGADVDALLAVDPGLAGLVDPARVAAAEALDGFAAWLEDRAGDADGDPRLGAERFAAKLWYTLDTTLDPDTLLARAEQRLGQVEEELAALAARLDGGPSRPGQVREVLDRLAAGEPVTDADVLDRCVRAVDLLTARVRELDLVTVPDDPVRVIVMPESRRGTAVAYCDPPGPLEPPRADGAAPASLFAVSPTPADWPADRVASFYREYNGHLLRNLAAHEAVPGHALQLAHAARYRGATRVRAATTSGTFVEGWAVYAESLIASVGLGLGAAVDDGLRAQQLKMQLRSVLNAILDVRVHTRGMSEEEARELLTGRGHQEMGEVSGKWRRALLTSTQLSTYAVGYEEVSGVLRRLRAARPGAAERELHDAVLAYGSPSPRHLDLLLDLPG